MMPLLFLVIFAVQLSMSL